MMAIPGSSDSTAVVTNCGLMHFPALCWLSVIETFIVVLVGSKRLDVCREQSTPANERESLGEAPDRGKFESPVL